MTSHSTLDVAESWCFDEPIARPVAVPDDTLSIIEARSREEELDVAAYCYEQAAQRGDNRVVFAVRDERAPRAEIVTGLRQRNVPVSQLPGIAPKDDPVVDKLLDVVVALEELESGECDSDCRLMLEDRTGDDIDVDEVLTIVAETDSLGDALHQWVAETRLVDRLVTPDAMHHRGFPQGTVDQKSSAINLGTFLETAAHLDTAATATSGSPSLGPKELVEAITERVATSKQELFATGELPPTGRPVAELVEMTELKLANQADVVIALEVTEELVDDDPSEQKFSAIPEFGRHPDIPGITSVSIDRAARTFGRLPHISDGKRAWFVGLGRRYLGYTLSAASDRAVLVTRRGETKDLVTRPSRSVVDLAEQLCLETVPAGEFLNGASTPADGGSDSEVPVDALLDELRDQLEVRGDREDTETGDDAALRDVVEQLNDAHRVGVLSPDQQRDLVTLLASSNTTQ
ncbi:hypothetical protein [Salinigranum halophilum]|uniref:hypothetical protein n=1 Tax=Salinigranum halophilum TaxID=2565931 RepID=UPI0010A7C69F|nr:hypothetical protein [Salinigranum halophilum]